MQEPRRAFLPSLCAISRLLVNLLHPASDSGQPTPPSPLSHSLSLSVSLVRSVSPCPSVSLTLQLYKEHVNSLRRVVHTKSHLIAFYSVLVPLFVIHRSRVLSFGVSLSLFLSFRHTHTQRNRAHSCTYTYTCSTITFFLFRALSRLVPRRP